MLPFGKGSIAGALEGLEQFYPIRLLPPNDHWCRRAATSGEVVPFLLVQTTARATAAKSDHAHCLRPPTTATSPQRVTTCTTFDHL
jgi:hypothetical protein